jgi:hypothetical protein
MGVRVRDDDGDGDGGEDEGSGGGSKGEQRSSFSSVMLNSILLEVNAEKAT